MILSSTQSYYKSSFMTLPHTQGLYKIQKVFIL